MANMRKKTKAGVSMFVEKNLKNQWQEEARKLHLSLTDYIIFKVSKNLPNALSLPQKRTITKKKVKNSK